MSYRFHLSHKSLGAAKAYLENLREGRLKPGDRLARELVDLDLFGMEVETFLDCLVNTKPPLIFAESSVFGDGRDWNLHELRILGDIGVSASVIIFDDGKHRSPEIHPSPQKGTLLFVPGALLRNDLNGVPVDLAQIAPEGFIDLTALTELYERRLLPLLFHANDLTRHLNGAVILFRVSDAVSLQVAFRATWPNGSSRPCA